MARVSHRATVGDCRDGHRAGRTDPLQVLTLDGVAVRAAPKMPDYLRAARTPRQEALRGWGSGLFSPTAPQALIDEVLDISSDFHPAALAALAQSFAETDLRAVLPTIDVPTLVLHGEADTRSPLSVGRALHAAIPGAELAVLAGIGHVSNVQAPQAFNAAVRRFLRSVPS